VLIVVALKFYNDCTTLNLTFIPTASTIKLFYGLN